MSIINTPPTVSAGADQTIRFLISDTTTLQGSANDDGISLPLVTTWTLQSGPNTASLQDSSSEITDVTFTEIGTYVFRLAAFDGLVTTFDEVTITVLPNTPPTADAGTHFILNDFGHLYGDGTVLLSKSHSDAYNLRGSVIDPDGQVITVTWSQDSGPGTATFSIVDNVASSVSFSQTGVYVLKLTADDGLSSASDTITFTVVDDHDRPTLNSSIVSIGESGPNEFFRGDTGPTCTYDIPALIDDGPSPLEITWRHAGNSLYYWYTVLDGIAYQTSGRDTLSSGNDPTFVLHGSGDRLLYNVKYTPIYDDGFYRYQGPPAIFSCSWNGQ